MFNFEANGYAALADFFDFCRNLEYGWVDAKGRKHHGPNNSPEYHLQTPAETMARRIGICWDQTELQRAWFTAHDYDTFSFADICYDCGQQAITEIITHAILNSEKSDFAPCFDKTTERVFQLADLATFTEKLAFKLKNGIKLNRSEEIFFFEKWARADSETSKWKIAKSNVPSNLRMTVHVLGLP